MDRTGREAPRRGQADVRRVRYRRRGRPATHLLTRGRNGGFLRLFFDESTGRPARFAVCLQYLTYRVILLPLLVNLLVATWLVLGGQRTAGGSPRPALRVLPSYQRVAGLLGALSVWLAGRFLDRRPSRTSGFT